MSVRTVAALRRLRALRWLPLLFGVACAVPPDYPPDDTHLSATQSGVCFGCHVTRAKGPRPHPSHFEEDGSLKVTRRACHSCHEPDSDRAVADSSGRSGARSDG